VTGGGVLDRVSLARSLLFVPGSRPDRFASAAAADPGLVILDLEDAVAATDKDVARANVRSWLRAGNVAMVRVNAAGTAWYAEDVAAIQDLDCAVMLPKCEHPDQVAGLHAALGGAVPIVALIETAQGVLDARGICAAAGIARMAFGSADLAAQLGVDPADTNAMQHARSHLVLAAAAAGIAGPVDSPSFDLTDETIWRAEAAHARGLGFTAKLCIHPRQVPVIDASFAPTEAELTWARAVLDSADDPVNGAVTTVGGSMIDAPVVARARRLLSRQ
jgi:citrate lyase subunit beta/citryl-CoA lyase